MALLQKGYLGSTPLFRDLAWFDLNAQRFIQNASATATANSSAHTKGSWQQIIASTSSNASVVVFQIFGIHQSGVNTAVLLDIGIGAASSEVIIAENIAVGGAQNGGNGTVFCIPLQIPSGSRIAARIQGLVTGGETASVGVFLLSSDNYGITPSSVDVIGGDTTTSQGISFSGASGTWVEGIASTTQAYRAVGLVASVHTTDAAAFTLVCDVGVGSAGNETNMGSFLGSISTTEAISTAAPFIFGPYGTSSPIPAGSRLAVRHNIAANPSRYGFTLIGIP